MDNKLLVKCLFGYHDYTIPDKNDRFILICKHCMRFGYYKNNITGLELWREYNVNGDITYQRNSVGDEWWWEYNKKGDCIHYRDSAGFEEWLHNYNWVREKPKAWWYEGHW